jgi:menaquinol-cytochrome c reductase iron-sulfur subunit
MTRYSRRRALITGTAVGGAAIGLMLSIPAIGFVISPLFQARRNSWVRVATLESVPLETPTPFTVSVPIDQGPPGEPVDRVVYVVRRRSGRVYVLSNTCSHMQCNVHWDPKLGASGQFLCPCHGGLYDITGLNVGGPPPSPLPPWRHRISTLPDGSRLLEIENQYGERI